MARLSKRDDADLLLSGQLRHVASMFMKDSLLSQDTRLKSAANVFPLMPDVVAVQIGGKLIDGGRKTLLPLLEEIRKGMKRTKMIIATSSGKRSKHVVAVAQDLGLPVGLVAELKRLDSELNSHMVGALLSPYGIAELTHAEMVHMLPAMLEISGAVVFNGVPPYDIWEHPPESGTEPVTGADAGVFLFASTCGMKRVIFIRDVDGIYDSDPKIYKGVTMIKRASAAQAARLDTNCIDSEVFKLMGRVRNPVEVHVVNGLKRGALTSLLAGNQVGTTVSPG